MTTEQTRLPDATVEEARIAAEWWLDERSDWPLDRALRVWLTYERPYWWDPEDEADGARYEDWYSKTRESARAMGFYTSPR